MSMTKKFDGIIINDISLNDFTNNVLKELNDNNELIITVTPNIDHFQRLRNTEDALFSKAYQIASYRLCDSRIVQKLSKFKNKQEGISNVVPGSDLTKQLLQQTAIKKCKITVVGTSEDEIKKIIKKYQLERVKHINPPMGFIKDPNEFSKCVDFILASDPDIIFLAVGSPAQEHLALTLYNNTLDNSEFSAQVFCIGASLDFLSGKSKRAPYWMQKCHIEWLHRACSQPKRLIPRYINNLKYIILFIFGRN